MATGFYPQFDVIRIDADGVRVPVIGASVDVVHVPTATPLDTLTTDAYGIIAAGSVTDTFIGIGDEVEFSIAGEPETTRLTLCATPAETFADTRNAMATYVVENLNPRRRLSNVAQVWAQDLSNPTSAAVFLGSGRAGETLVVPLQSNIEKTLRLYPISQDIAINNDRQAFDEAVAVDTVIPSTTLAVAIDENLVFAGPVESPAAAPTFRRMRYADMPPVRRTLFDIIENHPSPSGDDITWSVTIPSDTLVNDGDKIEFKLALETPSSNSTRIGFRAEGNYVVWTRNYTDPSLNGWYVVRGWIIKTDHNTVRACGEIHGVDVSGDQYCWREITEFTLDLTAKVTLDLQTLVTDAGDVLIKSGYGEYVPLANPDFDPPTVGTLTATAQDDTSILWEMETATDPLI